LGDLTAFAPVRQNTFPIRARFGGMMRDEIAFWWGPF